MIPLTRRSTPRKLQGVLLSCSRQSLPRPARLYSMPSKRNEAPALVTANVREQVADSAPDDDMAAFLQRKLPFTILPTLSPHTQDRPFNPNEIYFPSSATQDSLSVIDACLYNCYDVRRAKYVFSQLRENGSEAVLQPRVYNMFLDAYLEMASERDVKNRDEWLIDAWNLYHAMESGQERVSPIAGTYARMLKILTKANSEEVPNQRQTSDLLKYMNNRNISVMAVVADRSLDSGDAQKIIHELASTATKLGFQEVIKELGQVEQLAADPLAGVPEVAPVLRRKRCSPLAVDLPESALRKDEDAMANEDMPFNIANLRKHLAQVAYAQRVLFDDAAARQKFLEASVYDLAVDRLRYEARQMDQLGLHTGLLHAQLQKWMFEWHNKLKARLEGEIAELVREETQTVVEQRDHPNRMKLGAFLSLLKPDKLSLITILELMRLHGTGGVSEGMKTARALLTVGKAVEMEYKAEVLKKNNVHVPAASARSTEILSYFAKKKLKELREWRWNALTFMNENQAWMSNWTQAVRARVGSFLVDCLMDIATVKRTAIDKRTGEEVSENQPAFFHSYEYSRGHRLGVIRLNSIVAERLAKDDIKATLHPRHLPMLVRPKSWVSYDEGGYYYNKSSVMRLKDTQEQYSYLRAASESGHMEHIFASLDVLGSTPWRINRETFNVVLEVWNSGKRFLSIPPVASDIPEPVKPDHYDTDMKAKAIYIQRMKMWQLHRANDHSARCNVNYKVEIARAFLADLMYLPHSVDFRGRAYPIPPHLNHIGDDLSRGLMKFAVAKPLGKTGLRWLKIHLANLYGFDKGSFEERVQFTEQHMDDIFDSAENPLTGQGWWQKADDPWQCLAASKELQAALTSENPELYESSLPVHQDGTCNGLQHYAALGGDIQGARQVNLDVADRPADVYTHVATMVEEELEKGAAKGEEIAQMLLGRTSRKVVKQTVMTTVYGVTYVGARSQIEKQLVDRGEIPQEKVWDASTYLAKKVIYCIGDLFSGAKAIQNWLSVSARLISKSMPRERAQQAIEEYQEQQKEKGKYAKGDHTKVLPESRLPKEMMTSVVWTTPLGLPVVQPYRKQKRKQIMTSIQTVFITDPNLPTEVNPTKQASAFPPNFIHSLDATHMMLTALECRRCDIAFASVHDSYWTHACSVDDMNHIIRDTFIALHESDVLSRLREEFLERYKDFQIPMFSLRSRTFAQALSKKIAAALEKSGNAGSAVMAAKDANAVPDEKIVDDAEAKVDNLELDEPTATETGESNRKRKPKNGGALSLESQCMQDYKGGYVPAFIDLVDVLPELPKKGEFDVKKIRQSKYFFS